jgi:hypothetical protein
LAWRSWRKRRGPFERYAITLAADFELTGTVTRAASPSDVWFMYVNFKPTSSTHVIVDYREATPVVDYSPELAVTASLDDSLIEVSVEASIMPFDRGNVYAYYFSPFLGANVFLDTVGSREIDASHTLSLSAVTLADGTTPESIGYSVWFASGMRSPNIPEPGSLSLAVTAFCLITLRKRRG